MTTIVTDETSVVKADRDERAGTGESARLVNGKEMAERIEQIKARLEAKEPGGKLSMSEFSRRAGLARQHVTIMLDRLRRGRDIEVESIKAIASLGGVTIDWLITGREDPPGVLLRDVPGFAAAVTAATERYPSMPDYALWYVGSFRLPLAPARVDASFVKDLASAWHDAASAVERSAAQMAFVRHGK